MQTDKPGMIPEDEIDLGSFWGKIKSFVAYLYFLLRSNIKTTLLFVLLAVGLAIFAKYSIPKSYKSSFIIKPNDRNERFHLKILGDIQTLLKFGDHSGVARELGITDTVARKLLALQLHNPSLKNPVDSVNSTEVTILTSDFEQFLPLQKSLLNYLESNPFFAKIRKLQTEQIAISLPQVEKDIKQLDSLKVLQLSNYDKQHQTSQGGLFLNELINPTATYSMAIDRMNRKSGLMAQKVFLDNFQLIKSCVVVRQATFPPRILVMCLYLVPVFLLLCLVFLYLKSAMKT